MRDARDASVSRRERHFLVQASLEGKDKALQGRRERTCSSSKTDSTPTLKRGRALTKSLKNPLAPLTFLRQSIGGPASLSLRRLIVITHGNRDTS